MLYGEVAATAMVIATIVLYRVRRRSYDRPGLVFNAREAPLNVSFSIDTDLSASSARPGDKEYGMTYFETRKDASPVRFIMFRYAHPQN